MNSATMFVDFADSVNARTLAPSAYRDRCLTLGLDPGTMRD